MHEFEFRKLFRKIKKPSTKGDKKKKNENEATCCILRLLSNYFFLFSTKHRRIHLEKLFFEVRILILESILKIHTEKKKLKRGLICIFLILPTLFF